MRAIQNNNSSQTRNQLALNIFTKNGFSVRLFGNCDSPMFILENRTLLSCFLNGNSLHFRPSPDSGEILRTIKLVDDAYITKYEILELIEQSEHLPVSRIQELGSRMFLVGFNYFDLEGDVNGIAERYPVFANHNPLIYINQDKADMISSELKQQGYLLEVI